jgi:Fanconi anemia group M protein
MPQTPEQIISIKPRDYQSSIVETAKTHNTLVVLPTGLGKTLIALLLSLHRFQQHPTEKILFLAPTRPLVEQHFNTFKEQLPELYADCQLFTGATPAPQRKKIWQTAEIIFSTPQCIANDISKMRYNLDDTSLLVIDEAHRCLKNYAYTAVVKHYKDRAANQRILGLTASPGSEAVKVNEICNHLDIQQIEVRDRDSPDVAPFLQELEFEKVEVPFPKEFLEIKVLLNQLYMSKVNTLKERNLLFGPANKITLLKTQAHLASQASKRNWQAMVGMSLTAQAIKLSHAMELLETQTLTDLNAYLQDIKQQAEQKKSKGVQTLVNSAEFTAANLSLQQLIEKDVEHPKVEELATIIESQLQENPQAKTIVFTQFRDSASVIAQRLNQLNGINATLFLGQAKRTRTLKGTETTTGL